MNTHVVHRTWVKAAQAGLELFRVKKGGKAPVVEDWNKCPLDPKAEVEKACKLGLNLGLRPHSTAGGWLLIVDMDVKPAKKDGKLSLGPDSLRRLGDALGVDFENWPLRVETGPGYKCIVDREFADENLRRGLHIYLWLPESCPKPPRHGRGFGFPDLEFICQGNGFVLFPGSQIDFKGDGPHRPPYQSSYDLKADELDWLGWHDIPKLEDQAVRKLSALFEQASTRQSGTEKPGSAGDEPGRASGKPTADTFGIATLEEIEKLLGWLDPNDFPTNDEWLPVAMAVHHASGGDAHAKDLFLQWCAGVEGFDNDDNLALVERRWDSFGDKQGKDVRTARTLLDLAKKAKMLPNGFRFDAEVNAEGDDERPVLRVTGDNRNEVQTNTAMLLFEKAGKTRIFWRGPELVSVSKIGEATLQAAREGKAAEGFKLITDNKGRECLEKGGTRIYPGSTVVTPMSEHSIVFEAGAHIRYIKYDARAKEWKPVNAPTYISGLLKLPNLWPFYELQAVMHTPGIDFDTGEVQTLPGIMEEKGVLSDFNPQDFPDIRNDLSQEEATEKLEWVHHMLYRHFPFEGGAKGASSAVNLTGAICAMLRPLMAGGAPLHCYDAPQASTGKTKLAETHGILATGTIPPMANWSNDQKENGSRLGASLRRCPQILIYDNLDAEKGDALQFPHLNTAITEPKVTIRILGYSEEVELPTLTHFEATGNNIRIIGDMVSRVVKCRIDSGLADPSGRKFDFCPLQRAKDLRGKLVSALLSVVASYIKSGCPLDSTLINMRFGSGWRAVQGAIVWCGWEDPVKTIEAVRATDENLAIEQDAVEAWKALFGDAWVSAKQLWQLWETPGHTTDNDLDFSPIFECIVTSTHNIRTLSRSLGTGDRVVGGHTIRMKADNPREKLYRLEPRQ